MCCTYSRWEILTYGDYPFAGIQLERIQDLVREGLRLKKPEKCPESLWEVIARCWRETLVDRWRFQDLVPALQKLLTTHGPPPPPRDIGALVTSGTLSYDAVLKGGAASSPARDRRAMGSTKTGGGTAASSARTASRADKPGKAIKSSLGSSSTAVASALIAVQQQQSAALAQRARSKSLGASLSGVTTGANPSAPRTPAQSRPSKPSKQPS
eukprot:m.866269 g.866269  ORF g.866269 m.866269 type:complete len:212 (+) comp23552_c0_seq9:2666-3301(+)